MSRAQAATSIGVDFGTSNTVVALAFADGHVETIRFAHGGSMLSVYTSALCFWQDQAASSLPPQIEGGPWAVERLVEDRTGLRFLRSFKTFAASRNFQSTTIFRQRFQFQDLLVAFLRTLARHAGPGLDFASAPVIVGRPVRFAGANADEALAMQRYDEAFGLLGAREPRYVYEPVGAAFSFARDLDHDAVVLVADFGGGTSDFSLLRFSRVRGKLRAEPLGHGGLGIAGDIFDARLIDHLVAPRLGKNGNYRSFGKILPLPSYYHAKLTSWNELALMKGSKDLRELRSLAHLAVDPAPLHDFIALIERDLGFTLHQAISATKVALSREEEVAFNFIDGDVTIGSTVTRAQFEEWIGEDLARIGASVDEVLSAATIAPGDVDKVFLTGGTSFVPAVRRLFTERFGKEKLVSADQFESIATGLALIGRSEDPDQWAVAA